MSVGLEDADFTHAVKGVPLGHGDGIAIQALCCIGEIVYFDVQGGSGSCIGRGELRFFL
ncbi:MAG TPA: hypothetical protein VGE93_07635 [Bryobacteraceae bacterium]